MALMYFLYTADSVIHYVIFIVLIILAWVELEHRECPSALLCGVAAADDSRAAPGDPQPRLPPLARLVHALTAGDRAGRELELHDLIASTTALLWVDPWLGGDGYRPWLQPRALRV